MRFSIVLCLSCIILISCKTKIQSPKLEIKAKEVLENSFVLEKESDFDNIEKSYLIYIKWNFGSRKMNNDCNCPELEEKYILFRKENISFIQKVVGNAVYYPVKLRSNNILNLYSDTFSEFKNEKIKNFKTNIGRTNFSAHGVLKKYILALESSKPITINFREEDFHKDGFGEININYIHNKNLKFYRIDSLLNSEINELNKHDTFVFRKCRKD